MRLLELISSEKTDKNLEQALEQYFTSILCRKVVKTKDMAGFLAIE